MISTKKKILLFTDWYYPGYKAGGPIQSCRNLAARMSMNFSFYIFTSDSDLGANEPYSQVRSNEWIESDHGEKVFYARRKDLSASLLKRIVKDVNPDVIYFNSMFSYNYSILPLLVLKTLSFKGKIVLAPRGMLHEGALGLKSAKKKIFLSLFRLLGLHNKIHFHATDRQELTDINSCFPGVDIKLAENIPHLNGRMELSSRKIPGVLKLVYISRIHPTKNLHFLLEIFSSGNLKGNLHLDVYGNIDRADYWQQCQQLLPAVPANIAVSYKGELDNSKVLGTLAHYHAFVLPTLGENFGHAIYEALSSGLPVLISDRTPWRHLQEAKAGWDLSLAEPDSFGNALQDLIDMDEQVFGQWSLNARQLAENYVSKANFTEKYVALFS